MKKLWAVVLIAVLGCSDASTTNTGSQPDVPNAIDGTAVTDITTPQDDVAKVKSCINQPEGTPCDDGNQCTLDDVCEQGSCVGSENLICGTEDACRLGTCNPQTGCSYVDADNDTPCQVACFSQASCQNGQCKPQEDSAIQCPKANKPCVDQLQCNTETGECTVEILKPKDADCNSDDDTCTFETCTEDGECKSTGEIEKCKTQQQNNPCWIYTCNKKTGCTQTSFFEGGSCDDGNDCSINDTCKLNDVGQKLCIGEPVNVDDKNPCTSDSCKNGEVLHQPINGLPCDPADGCDSTGLCSDGVCVADQPCECKADTDCASPDNLCLGKMVCDTSGAGGVCKLDPSTKVTCAPSPSPCTQTQCNPQTGQCESTAVVGIACDDLNACTQGDICTDKGCEPGKPLVCDDNDMCNGTETCDAKLGCQAGTPLSCNDQNVCNGTETCDAQQGCLPGKALECDDNNLCTGTETCDPTAGCQPGKPLTCNDQNLCNGVETCNPQLGCQPGEALQCDDNNACTGTETCDSQTGCQPGKALICNDKNVCNGIETCNTTTGCVKGTPLDCKDDDPCSEDACDPINGCNTGDQQSCDDSNPCTEDSCTGPGQCDHVKLDGTKCPGGQCMNGWCAPMMCVTDLPFKAGKNAQSYDFEAMNNTWDYNSSPKVELVTKVGPPYGILQVFRHSDGTFGVLKGGAESVLYRATTQGEILYKSAIKAFDSNYSFVTEAANGDTLGLAFWSDPVQPDHMLRLKPDGTAESFYPQALMSATQLPNGNILVAMTQMGGRISEISAKTGKLVQHLAHWNNVEYPYDLGSNLAVHPDGSIWTIDTGNEPQKQFFKAKPCGPFLKQNNVPISTNLREMTILPNGDLLVQTAKNTSERWDSKTLKKINSIPLPRTLSSSHLAQDGRVYLGESDEIWRLTFPCKASCPDDGDPCTVATCVPGGCEQVPVPVCPDPDKDGINTFGNPGPCTWYQTEACNDNCPNIYNPKQLDEDADGIGDVCDDKLDTPCPKNFIRVPANLDYGTETFCVSQFEMKVAGNDDGELPAELEKTSYPQSRPSGTPWIIFDGKKANAACAGLGSNYTLISNNQWQALARNIEAVPANWTGAIEGEGKINRGHSDLSPAKTLSVTNANDPCDGTGNPQCTNFKSSDFSQKRTHTLSSGDIIWDLAGNASEYVGGLKLDVDATHFAQSNPNQVSKKQVGPAGTYSFLPMPKVSTNPSPAYNMIHKGAVGFLKGSGITGAVWVLEGGIYFVIGSHNAATVYAEPNAFVYGRGSFMQANGAKLIGSKYSLLDQTGSSDATAFTEIVEADYSQCGGACPPGINEITAPDVNGLGFQNQSDGTQSFGAVRGGDARHGPLSGIFTLLEKGTNKLPFYGFRCVRKLSSCVIDSQTYGAGQSNPDNPCETCEPHQSTTTWTVVTNGSACNAQTPCTGVGQCQAGACVLDLNSDGNNCGSCGNVCLDQQCTNGKCTLSCQGSLNRVWGAATNEVWAVGQNGAMQHYNGNQWSSVDPGTDKEFLGIWGSSDSDIWATGDGVLAHYNGKEWNTSFTGPAVCTTRYDIWGSDPDNFHASHCGGYFIRWDGTEWSAESVSGGEKRGVGGCSASDIWAAENGAGWITHWNGDKWSQPILPDGLAQVARYGVECVDKNNVYMVGEKGNIVRFDGAKWTTETSGVNVTLREVANAGTNAVVAVGDNGTIIHRIDGVWKTIPSGTKDHLRGVWVGIDGMAWIVGDNCKILKFNTVTGKVLCLQGNCSNAQ